MKSSSFKIVLFTLLTLVFCIACFAAGKIALSPAYDKIEKDIVLRKCGVVNSKVKFSAEDFDDVMYSKTDKIKVLSLPDKALGTLYADGNVVKEKGTVSRKDLDSLTFVPNENKTFTTSFTLRAASKNIPDTDFTCTISVLSEVNLAPNAPTKTIVTAENISVFKFLEATDPENDEILYRVVSYPSHGRIEIEEDAGGYFCYYPEPEFSGKDSFEYCVTDCYGNKSEPSAVEIFVEKEQSGIYFDDLENHWAHYSAKTLADNGLMKGVTDEKGNVLFCPDETVTRGDFLAMALISAGFEDDIKFTAVTSFADDASIPVNIKSYAEYAKEHGIINGYEKGGETVFNSTSPITRSEAAVMVDRILSLPDADINGEINVFADFASCPDWAGESLESVAAAGIMNGTGFGEILPGNLVTRAETAEILCNTESYSKKNGIIF